ncbi:MULTISPECIES: MDR family MFS transporter [Geobacillus]|jgi:EmrB/QacA subfamily drug resistance transporter|uniref:MFS-type drug efflux transporter P55 n=2 Tax=Geobacillus thermodenitrificans TaxID=33940 RepID=A4IMI4_GEOTN|nr:MULTISPECIES: MDR family MFS transporter [Geobacillus]ABO66538.1 Permease, MDR related [Geobacillus thermodenitrificans NG80-2]ARA97082.1 major facilitator superfamily transporter [Geobacillus thermodenitrificans]ATO36364.1 major facilitator superfamily transporter [Geobacillus thermodenitrificans]MEC5188667.1 EmrB/QacA subfamily drug resistance transporter [Geobacillus thermodenitrificans]MED0663574.1 MFS transporter [Geobacillus thermodenitrificans]
MNSRLSVMVSIVLAMLVASMDTTIMNTTMPIIAKELEGFSLYAWTFASYMITTTVLSPIAGRLSDLFGRKKVFSFGIILFLIGSLLCGLSQNMVQLVLFRALQGVGAGFMMPFPAIIAGDLFPVEKRGKIQAFFTAMWGLSAVLAPLLGSLFVEYATWRWIFYVNIPICVLSLLTLLPYKEVYEPKRAAIDYVGAALFATAISLLLLVTVVEQGQWWYGAAGVLLLVIFYYFEKRQPSPLVPLSLVHHRTLKWMNINGFVSCVALFGTSSYIPLFLQNVAHLSVFMSGVALLGSSVGWMIAAVPAGKWILRYGYRSLLIIGNVLLVASGLFLALLNESHGFWYVFFIMFLQGLSFGLTSTVGVIGSQQLADAHEKGIATSFFMFCRNIGTAIGVTVMGAFLAQASTFMAGIRHLFLFGLIGSIIAMITSLFIRDETEADRNNQQSEGMA